MPIFDYKCSRCGEIIELLFTSIRLRDLQEGEGIEHFHAKDKWCGGTFQRIFTPTKFFIDDIPFDTVDWETTGQPISMPTKGKMRQVERQHGVKFVEERHRRSHKDAKPWHERD
jgi:predicted nucleic acid-binding Zn ribbon protein